MFQNNPNNRYTVLFCICVIIAIIVAIVAFGQWPQSVVILMIVILSMSGMAWRRMTSKTDES